MSYSLQLKTPLLHRLWLQMMSPEQNRSTHLEYFVQWEEMEMWRPSLFYTMRNTEISQRQLTILLKSHHLITSSGCPRTRWWPSHGHNVSSAVTDLVSISGQRLKPEQRHIWSLGSVQVRSQTLNSPDAACSFTSSSSMPPCPGCRGTLCWWLILMCCSGRASTGVSDSSSQRGEHTCDLSPVFCRQLLNSLNLF